MRLANLNPATDFLTYVRCKAVGRNALEAEGFAESIGASDRVQRLLKDVGALSSDQIAGDRASMVNAYIAAGPKNPGAFLTMYGRGFRQVPIDERMAIMTGTLTGGVVGEGVAKPVSKLSFENRTLARKKTATLTIATRETWADPRAEATINGEQRYVTSTALDADFFEANETDALVFESEGAAPDLAALDVKKLVLSVGMAANAAPFFVAGVDAAKRAATLTTSEGRPVFEQMSPLGGRIAGIECLVSDGLSTDDLALVNAASFAAAVENILVKTSEQATVEMSAMPSNEVNTPTAAQLVSMFQTNSVAVLTEIFFGWEKLRSDAIAIVTGIGWGYEVTL